jgi:hypothetical protein
MFKPKGVAALLLWVGFYTLFWAVCFQLGWVTVEENGAIESAQAVLLALAALVFLGVALSHPRGAERLFYVGYVLLCLSFFQRELNVHSLNVSPILVWLGSGIGKKLWMAIAWLWLSILFVRRVRALWPIFTRWLQTLAGHALLLGGLCYVLAGPFDRNLFPQIHRAVLVEELLEGAACLLIFLSSWLSAAARAEGRLPRGVPSAAGRAGGAVALEGTFSAEGTVGVGDRR